MECSYKNRSHWKTFPKEKKGTLYVLIYPLSKFEGNRTNSLWVLAFYSVRFKWKKLIRKNSAKNANQTGNFYFRPKLKTAISLPIFQWYLFYIRDFIWISSFPKIWRKLSIWRYTVTLNLLFGDVLVRLRSRRGLLKLPNEKFETTHVSLLSENYSHL